MRTTRLDDAVMTGADLTGANLAEANLRQANLYEAKLDGAIYRATIMPDGTTAP